VDLTNRVRTENPGVWTDELGDEVVDLITEAVELEKIYAYEVCPDEILEISAEQFAEYIEHIADRRLGQLDLPEQYGTDNLFPWMSEQVDLNKETNFFEAQVTEYRSGSKPRLVQFDRIHIPEDSNNVVICRYCGKRLKLYVGHRPEQLLSESSQAGWAIQGTYSVSIESQLAGVLISRNMDDSYCSVAGLFFSVTVTIDSSQ
jgi:hypothetical protein